MVSSQPGKEEETKQVKWKITCAVLPILAPLVPGIDTTAQILMHRSSTTKDTPSRERAFAPGTLKRCLISAVTTLAEYMTLLEGRKMPPRNHHKTRRCSGVRGFGIGASMRGFETLHVLSHLTVANLEQVPFAARFVSGLAGTLYTFPKQWLLNPALTC